MNIPSIVVIMLFRGELEYADFRLKIPSGMLHLRYYSKYRRLAYGHQLHRLPLVHYLFLQKVTNFLIFFLSVNLIGGWETD